MQIARANSNCLLLLFVFCFSLLLAFLGFLTEFSVAIALTAATLFTSVDFTLVVVVVAVVCH